MFYDLIKKTKPTLTKRSDLWLLQVEGWGGEFGGRWLKQTS